MPHSGRASLRGGYVKEGLRPGAYARRAFVRFGIQIVVNVVGVADVA